MFYFLGREPGSFVLNRAPSLVRHLGIAAASLLLGGVALARPDVPLTLAETETLALQAEPGQQALQARAAALEAQAVVAGELPDPMLRLGLNNFPIESGGFSTEGMTNFGVGLRQAFPAGDTRSLSARRFELMAIGVQQNADVRARNVLTAARSSWLELYYWHSAHDLVNSSRPLFEDLATITRSLYAVGRKSQQDVLRAELELSRLDDRLIEIERQQAGFRAMLGEWIGTESVRKPARKLPDWPAPPAIESLQQAVLEHPRVRAAEADIEARGAGVELAEQRSKPSWAIDFGYSYREGNLPSGQPRSDMVTLGVTVGLPFFSRKSVDSTLSAALQEQTAARAAREQVVRELRRQLDAEYARWHDLTRRLALYDERILKQASIHAEASLLAYQNDRADFAEVMRAYINDLNTRTDYVRLQVERAQSFAMLANLGGITL